VSRLDRPTGPPYATYDPVEVHDLLWAGWHGEMGWDVGANQGQSVDRMVHQFTRVLAFEPARESFADLKADWGHHPGVEVFQVALSGTEGELALSVCPHAILGGQLIATSMIGGEEVDNPWFTGELTRRTVPCTTLDALAAEHGFPDFVKIDTEGGELDILHGGQKVLEHGKTDFLVEFHSPKLRRECEAIFAGYTVEWIRDPLYKGQGDPQRDQNGWLRVTHP
jgi:FkbM family methyltransferase